MDGKIGLRIVSGLVLIAAIAGIAFFAFRAGVAQGSPVTIEAPSGDANAVPAPYPNYGYGMPFHHRHFGFGFGCLGLLIPLILFFLAIKAFRFMIWGSRWGHHMLGHSGRHWEGGAPGMFEDWHKRAHGEAPKDENKE